MSIGRSVSVPIERCGAMREQLLSVRDAKGFICLRDLYDYKYYVDIQLIRLIKLYPGCVYENMASEY